MIVRCAAAVLMLGMVQSDLRAQDSVHLKDGRTETGMVTEQASGFLVMRPSKPGQAIQRIETGKVATVRFGTRPEMERAAAAQGNERLELLRRVWYLMRPSIALPESPSGEWGLQFAGAILNSDLPDHVKLSFEVFQTIETTDWNRERRHAARRGRFNAMLNLGLMEEAMAEAHRVADDPNQEDPDLLILARMMLGDLAFRELKEIEKENPRWDQDDDVRPRRNALYDRALDHYLFAHLYHGDQTESAARGLWAAIEVMNHGGESAAAAARAHDLVSLYPGTPEAESAQALAKEAPALQSEEPQTEEEATPSEDGDSVKPEDPESPDGEVGPGTASPELPPAAKSKSSRKKKSTTSKDTAP